MQLKYIFSIPFNLFQRLTSPAKAIKVFNSNFVKNYGEAI